SLRDLAISPPMQEKALLHIIGEVVRRNRVRDGIVYMQVTRGAGPREFALPVPDVFPTLVVFARARSRESANQLSETGIAVKTVPDNRWGRRDIKTVMLL